MKKLRFNYLSLKSAILVICILLVGLPTQAGTPKTPEGLARAFVKVFRKNNAKKMRKLTVNLGDFKWMFEHIDAPKEIREKQLKRIEDEWEKVQAELDEHTVDQMNFYHTNSEFQVNWKKLKLIKAEIQDEKDADGIEICDVEITVTDGKKRFKLVLREIGHVGRGWVLAGDGFRLEERD